MDNLYPSEIPSGAIADGRHVFWVVSFAPKDTWQPNRGFYDPLDAIACARAGLASDRFSRHVSVCARGFLAFRPEGVTVSRWDHFYLEDPEPAYLVLRDAWEKVRGDARSL